MKVNNPNIIIAFKVGKHQQDRIIHTNGILPTMPAGSHLTAAWMNLILVIEGQLPTDESVGLTDA